MKKIFCKEGKSMKFFMETCEEKLSVQKLILTHHGTMCKKYSQDCIELVPYLPGFKLKFGVAKKHALYSYKFIQDSVASGILQNLKNYEVKPESWVGGKTKAPKPRKFYTSADESKMIDYVKFNPGQASSRSYWEFALSNGLGLDHSSNSLVHHWKYVLPKRYNMNFILEKLRLPNESNLLSPTQNFEQEENASTASEYTPQKETNLKRKSKSPFSLSKKLKTTQSSPEISQMQTFEDYTQIQVRVTGQERKVFDMQHLRRLVFCYNIAEYFQKLVDICRRSSCCCLEEAQVAQVLIQCQGDVHSTISFFSSYSSKNA